VALLWSSTIFAHLYERRLGLLYLLPGLHGVDPFPDAFDDCRMSGDCFYSIGQNVKIDKTFPDECGGEVLVLLFESDELGQDTVVWL
jgi:hypothetical protein